MPEPGSHPSNNPSTDDPSTISQASDASPSTHASPGEEEDLFAGAVFVVGYTADQALEDGMLVEVAEPTASDHLLRVELGRLVATPGALEALQTAGVSPYHLLARHQAGDWGDLDQEDRAANDRAVRERSRLLSRYDVPGAPEPIWIITEWDRSITTLLLPSEY